MTKRKHNVTIKQGTGSHTITVWDVATTQFPSPGDIDWDKIGKTVQHPIYRGECADCLWIDRWWNDEKTAREYAQKHADKHSVGKQPVRSGEPYYMPAIACTTCLLAGGLAGFMIGYLS